MSSTTIQVRMNQDDKKAVQKILQQLGLDLPTAIRAFLKKVRSTRSVPLDLRLEPEVDENGLPAEQVEAILRSQKEAEIEINVSPTFDTGKEAIKYLRSRADED